jgi:hypothetical protein
MDIILLFLGLVVTIIAGGIIVILSHSSQEQSTPASGEKIEGTNFIPSQMCMGTDGLSGLAVNERTRQICLLKSPSSAPHLLPITDLIGSYFIKNGELYGEGKRRYPKEIVTFSNELQRKKEALIKNLHMAASHASNQRIDVLMVIHDQDEPFHVVNFLDMETKEGGILFEKAMSTATHWHYVLDGLILQADQLAQHQTVPTQEKEMAETAP